MLLDVVFLDKKNRELSHDILVENFKDRLDFKDKQIFCDEISFNYKFQKSKNKNNIRLKISTLKGTSTRIEAKEIDILKNRIKNGSHRKDYRIIIVYDGASEYCCTKLSRFISIFERKLRQFIYIITLAAYGNKWIEETFFDDIKKEIKEKESDEKRHVEMALECFTFQNYIDYLFEKRCDEKLEDILQSAVEVADDSNSNKEDVLKILNKAKKVSLWDKLFNGYEMEFLETDIEKIRKIRNDVMHNKEISLDDFETYKKLLRECNKKLECAISRVESDNYPETVNIVDIFYSLRETMQSMVNLRKSVIESIAPAIKDLITITDKITKTINIDKISELYKLSFKNQIVDRSQLISQSYINSIDSLQKSLVSNNIFEKANFNTNFLKGAVPNFDYISEEYKETFNPMLKIRTSSIDYKLIKNITNDYYTDIINSKIPNIDESAFNQYNGMPFGLTETIKSLNGKIDVEDDGTLHDKSE